VIDFATPRYFLTLPVANSPLGRWVMHLATFLGVDYDPNAITHAVFVLADRADGRTCSDCGHPLVEHDDRIMVATGQEPHGCRWCDNRRGGALCGCTRRFPDAQVRKLPPVPAELWDAAVADEVTTGSTVYLAQGYGNSPTDGYTLLGVSTTRPGALAMIGAAVIREGSGWNWEVVPVTLDDPAALGPA
jgi:hypothetical protein